MTTMYRLKVKKGRSWKVGINAYSYEEAQTRQARLAEVGIASKIFSEFDLFRADIPVVW